jgi:hypothetical protein
MARGNLQMIPGLGRHPPLCLKTVKEMPPKHAAMYDASVPHAASGCLCRKGWTQAAQIPSAAAALER